MTTPSGPAGPTTLSADEAFALLGEETRLAILQVLGEADRPLAFSEVFDRVAYEDSSNFAYHLEKLVGHFVRKTEAGYALGQAGRRVVEAILSGIITADAVLERTAVDAPCVRCGEPVAVRYRDERLELYCAACGGLRGGTSTTTSWASEGADVVGYLDLPPAGIRNRTAAAAHRAAEVWTVAETQALARGVCPRCAARVEHEVEVCDDHDAGDGRCAACDQAFAATIHAQCTNCILSQSSVFTKHLLANGDLMAFLHARGVDPIAPEGIHLAAVEETIHSTESFEATFTFALEGESISLTVDDDLAVIEVARSDEGGAG